MLTGLLHQFGSKLAIKNSKIDPRILKESELLFSEIDTEVAHGEEEKESVAASSSSSSSKKKSKKRKRAANEPPAYFRHPKRWIRSVDQPHVRFRVQNHSLSLNLCS